MKTASKEGRLGLIKKRVKKSKAIKANSMILDRIREKNASKAKAKSNGHAPKKGKATKTTKSEAPKFERARLVDKDLKKKYPQVILGTLGYDKAHHKQTVTIACVDCKKKRDVFTSDLFQVTRCVECTAERRQERRREARKARQE